VVVGRFGAGAHRTPPGKRKCGAAGPPAELEVQVAQLDHLVLIRELLGVELGVVPLNAPMPVVPLSGFRVLDDEFVFVESLAGEQRLDGLSITPILRAFDVLRAASLTGPDAVALIQRVAAELRG
jgi:Domain of unknown function (DUF5753)